MKKFYKITLCVFLFSSSVIISQWYQVGTVPTTELKNVKFFNEHIGVTCGTGGIWRSTNSGVNWTQVLSVNITLHSLSFPSNDIGFTSGDSGKIYKTSNNGMNWNLIGNGITSKKLYTVFFPSINTGWIMGQNGKILYSYNSGISFINQSNGDTLFDINYLQMMNSSTGYYCGSGNANAETFGNTVNGGINWLYLFYMNGNILNSVSYVPLLNQNVIAVGTNGIIRRTTTNGTIWNLISSPVNINLNHILFLNSTTGFIAGNNGNILKTTNSGSNWYIEAIVTANHLKYLSFINSTIGWLVGSNGTVLRTGIPVSLNNNERKNNITKIKLYNYPNPFNPQTNINFELIKNSYINLTIYDILGNKVETLINGELVAGRHSVEFNGENNANGIYICRLQADITNEIQIKMILIK